MTSRRLMDCPKNKKSAPFCGCPNRKQCCCRGLLFVPPLAFVDCLLACLFVRSPSSLSLCMCVCMCCRSNSAVRQEPNIYISHRFTPHHRTTRRTPRSFLGIYTHTLSQSNKGRSSTNKTTARMVATVQCTSCCCCTVPTVSECSFCNEFCEAVRHKLACGRPGSDSCVSLTNRMNMIVFVSVQCNS